MSGVHRDFPGGEGESKYVGRGSADDINTDEGRYMYGFKAFKVDDNKGLSAEFVEKVNRVLV